MNRTKRQMHTIYFVLKCNCCQNMTGIQNVFIFVYILLLKRNLLLSLILILRLWSRISVKYYYSVLLILAHFGKGQSKTGKTSIFRILDRSHFLNRKSNKLSLKGLVDLVHLSMGENVSNLKNNLRRYIP